MLATLVLDVVGPVAAVCVDDADTPAVSVDGCVTGTSGFEGTLADSASVAAGTELGADAGI